MKAYTRRYQDLKILYDLDFPDRSQIIRQRTYRTEDGTIETPITSMLLARVIQEDCPAPAKRFEPRNIVACFANPSNQTGESNFTVMIPYRPATGNHRAHALEILQYPGVLAGGYTGEIHDRSVEPYLD